MHSLKIPLRNITAATWGLLLLTSCLSAEVIVDFEEIPLGPNSYFNGPVPGADIVNGLYGPEAVGNITSHGVGFVNKSDLTFGNWSGFAVSNTTDTTTAGFGNQYSAYTGGGANGSSNYAVAYSNNVQLPFDSTNVDHLWGLPSLILPAGFEAVGTMITNTTYAALSMINGDGFAKKFGGEFGNDADYFKLSVFGIDAFGNAMGKEIEFYLADYSFEDNSLDYILDEWVYLDLTDLAGAASLHFNLSSSDVGDWGMNTPAYFAMDNLTLQSTAVPEPATLSLLTLSGLVGGIALRRRSLNEKSKSAA